MSREQEGDEHGKKMSRRRKTKGRKLQHLYLMFDDWDSGYSIRRLSPGSDSGEGEGGLDSGVGEGAKQPLPGVFSRIWAPRGLPRCFASAFGTRILVLHVGASPDDMGIPIINVKDQSFFFGPQPNYLACPIYIPIGDDRLFVLDIDTFNVCYWMPDSAPWVWHTLPYPPFGRHDVSAYAVQPDGCILISTKCDTFIFNTKEYVWKLLYCDWAFPFTGCGHYDPSQDVFVGISNDPKPLGYLISCSMPITCPTHSTGYGDTATELPYHKLQRRNRPYYSDLSLFKCSTETLYSTNPAEKHVCATLVRMRGNKFCLVECVDTRADEEILPWELLDPVELLKLETDWERLERETIEEPSELGTDQELLEPRPTVGNRFLYRLKTFFIRYDANGFLKLEKCGLSLQRSS